MQFEKLWKQIRKFTSSKENVIRDVDYLISNNKIRLCTI